MKKFFDDGLLLCGDTAKALYEKVKDLPIIDYHCHLDQKKIAADEGFEDIGKLWLECDHYKWRAMRACGVDERYVTGDASYYEKFVQYARIMPSLIGNPLYYWTHMELSRIFGINIPLNADTADEIYTRANEVLKTTSVQKLLKDFKVEYIATTDDPCDDLCCHGTHGGIRVAPTFRPDKLYSLDEGYIAALQKAAGIKIDGLDDLLCALEARLDFFVSRGCTISDHGFDAFPSVYPTKQRAKELFANRAKLTKKEKDELRGFLLVWLTKAYAKRNMLMQIHFAVTRNVNEGMFAVCGADSGFDVMSEAPSVKNIIGFLSQVSDEERPQTVLYTLNDSNLAAIACLAGAFKGVRVGAAWWFNDTVCGIRRMLQTVSEYSVLGTSLGMLTDSRSFSSYCRFDFFRRILCSFVAKAVDEGEYDINSAQVLLYDICYGNVKEIIGK